MNRPKRILVPTLLLLLSGIVSAESDWPEKQTEKFIHECIYDVVETAKEDYFAVAQRAGNLEPNPFPEQSLRASVEPLCLCLTEKLKDNDISYETAISLSPEVEKITMSAIATQECRLGGLMGEALDREFQKTK